MSISRWICWTKEFFREYLSAILPHLLHRTLPKPITDTINTWWKCVLNDNSLNYPVKKRQKYKTTQKSFSLAYEFRNAQNICNFSFRNCCSLTAWPWWWKHDIPSKHREMITQYHIVASSYHHIFTSRMRSKRNLALPFLRIYFSLLRCDPTWARTSSLTRFLDHTRRLTTVGRTPLDEWSARRRDLYLIKHNTHNWEIFMGFESTISAGERPLTYALDRAATGTGFV